jgi:hypothetical protein
MTDVIFQEADAKKQIGITVSDEHYRVTTTIGVVSYACGLMVAPLVLVPAIRTGISQCSASVAIKTGTKCWMKWL